MMFTPFQLRALCSRWRRVRVGSGPLSPLWLRPQAGTRDKRLRAELGRSGSARLRGGDLPVGGCGDPVR